NNPWSKGGNSVQVFVRGPASFGIQFTNVPQKACATLAVKTTSGHQLGLIKLTINSQVKTTSDFPLSLITATGLCTSNVNGLEWEYTLHGSDS
ncbi:MAG TPA: type 4 pilus major pilin, partial [Alphaproteobacteria bacterium]|nr:type 4 pilus major pilin [Alphaproteobacteria bacterium]